MKTRKDRDAELVEQDKTKKMQLKIMKQFNYLNKVSDNDIHYEFAKAQATEVCDYLIRLIITPFKSWEAFLLETIERDEREFCYRFYVKRNEFGVFKPDLERLEELKIPEVIEVPEDVRPVIFG